MRGATGDGRHDEVFGPSFRESLDEITLDIGIGHLDAAVGNRIDNLAGGHVEVPVLCDGGAGKAS